MRGEEGIFIPAILKALKKGAQPGSELIISANEEIPLDERPHNPKKPFAESLLCLLHQKKIRIEGYNMDYDTSRKTKQSFNPDGFIFSLIKKEPFEIMRDILKLDEPREDESKKAYFELRDLFKKKTKEIEDSNIKNWNSLKEKIEVRKPEGDEILFFHAKQKILSEINEESLVAEHYEKEISYYTGEIEEMMQTEISNCRKNLPQIIEEHKEISLFLLKIPENEELDECESKIKVMNPKPDSISRYHLFTNKKLTKEEFLTKIGFEKPINRSHNFKEELFQDVFSYINSQEKGRDALIDRFSRGLSDRNNSKELLNELVYEATSGKESLINDYLVL